MNSSNICSIYHNRFKKLVQITNSQRIAQLLDYILLGWQESMYTLKDSTQKWFMKPYQEIVNDTMIPKSSLERYIKELSDCKLIIRRQALYSRKNKEGIFEVKKGCYIHPTQNLLNLLETKEPEKYVSNNIVEQKNVNIDSDNLKTNCIKINENEGIENIKMGGSYIRDLYKSLNINNINDLKAVNTVDNSEQARKQSKFDTIVNYLNEEIKEEVPKEIKALIISTFCNLIFKHNKEFSNPKQLAAEYLWALVNMDFYLPWTKDLVFRNNILAKMIRNNDWRTPKGFFKHSWLGNEFKKPVERENTWAHIKHEEMNNSKQMKSLIGQVVFEKTEPQLVMLDEKIKQKSGLIELLRKKIQESDTEEMVQKIAEHIQKVRCEIENLMQERIEINQDIGICA